jgi:putative ABC transport system permease protein
METLWQDLRYGARVFLSNPGFTLIAVITLALGIGANTAIFSVVKSVLIEPLPFAEPDRLMQIRYYFQQTGRQQNWIAHRDVVDWQADSRSFESIGAYQYAMLNLSADDQPEAVYGLRVTRELLHALGVQPQLGRYFLPEEDQAGRNRVILLSDDLWRRRFAARPDIVGTSIRMSGENYVVVGVMPSGFNFPLKLATEVQIPSRQMGFWAALGADVSKESRNAHSCGVVARLKPGVKAEEAQTELEAVAAQLAKDYPQTNAGRSVRLVSLKDQVVGDARPVLLVLFGAIGLVVLIACANIANLLLARADSRSREMAVRLALGASRLRLVRQALTESLVLALLGGVAGFLLALCSLAILLRLSPQTIPRLLQSRIDSAAFAFTLGVTLAAGILFGLAPAWRAAQINLNESLKAMVGASTVRGSRGGVSSTRRGRALRVPGNLLIVLETALALILTLWAGLLLNSFVRVSNVDPGFRADHVLAAIIVLPRAQYPDPQSNVTFFRRVVEQVEAMPEVESAGFTDGLPLSGQSGGDYVTVEGRPQATSEDISLQSHTRSVSPEYLRTLGIPLLRGRAFTAHDNTDAPPVAVINDVAAQNFWPGEDPVGKRFRLGPAGGQKIWREVVGIVNSTRHAGLDQSLSAEIYLPAEQYPVPANFLVVRSMMQPQSLAVAARQAVAAVDKNQPIFFITSMEELLADSLSGRRFSLQLLGLFSVLALILSSVGIYGVISYQVAKRTREIGIRMALGAVAGDVQRMVIGQAMWPTIIGLAFGLLGFLLLKSLVASLLYGVSATDPVTIAIVSTLLLVMAFLASYLPARRAVRVDPMAALRHE